MARLLARPSAQPRCQPIQRARRRLYAPRLFLLALCAGPSVALAAASCDEWFVVVSAVEGHAELQRSETSAWLPVENGDRLCANDTLRVDVAGNALLTMPDESLLRIGENAVLTLPEIEEQGTLINLLRGIIHVISRDPRGLRFTTPYANAGLEGTEFDIRANAEEGQTEITVLEGVVSVTTPRGQLSVPEGNIAVARPGAPPTVSKIDQPIDAMRWTAHYPRIIDSELPRADIEPTTEQRRDAEFFALRAAAKLEAGLTDDAEADIAAALSIDSDNTTALSLSALVHLARADRTNAERLAAAATARDIPPAPALIARSYIEQDRQAVAAAMASVREALRLEPTSAIATTRLAELLLDSGDIAAAVDTARRAVELAPRSADPLMVLGFAQLRRFDGAQARIAFQRAIALAPEAPLPHVGLAITETRDGNVVEGRRQLEIAVANDPTSSLARSYMAKLYGLERRYRLGARQLALANDFDPDDPTPLLYSAYQNLWANRPVEALSSLQQADERNGGRPAFRSRLLLDDDLATRNAGRGKLYTTLGFERMALVDAWQAVAAQPSDFAAHRLLADAYSNDANEDIARVSELLVAQLLQPINLTPIKPQLGRPTSFVTRALAPSDRAFNEFGPLVTKSGERIEVSALGGSMETFADDVSVAGLHDRFSYSVGQYRFKTDGFRPNNDLDEKLANAFFQYRPNQRTGFQAELRSARSEQGFVLKHFDPDYFDTELRQHEDADSLRLGVRRDLNDNHTLLVSAIYQDVSADGLRGSSISIYDTHEAHSLDTQVISRGERHQMQSGLSYARSSISTEARLFVPGIVDVFNDIEGHQTFLNLYSYAHLSPTPQLEITAGVSADKIADPLVDEQELNPKLGVSWHPTHHTTLRVGAFRTLFTSLTTSRHNPQPRLEPVQLAGFSQLTFGGTADQAVVRAVGLDHAFSDHLFVGTDAVDRDVDRTIVFPFDPVVRTDVASIGARTRTAHLNWAPTDRLALSTRYERGRYTSTSPDLLGYTEMRLERLPVELRYFAPVGLTAGWRATHVDEEGLFTQAQLADVAPGQDRFWVFDAFLGYRLPNRRGILSLNAENLLDERFRFQDSDPENMSIVPERVISMRFTLAFD